MAFDDKTAGAGRTAGIAYSRLLMNMAVPAIDYVTRPRIVGHEKNETGGQQ